MAYVFTTNTGDGDHPLADAPNAGVNSDIDGAGITGGLTDARREAEQARIANAPVVSGVRLPDADFADITLDRAAMAGAYEVNPDSLPPFTPPRHDMFAAENSGIVPDRVIPGGVTNAHPDFAVDNAGLTTTRSLSTTGRATEEAEAVTAAEIAAGRTGDGREVSVDGMPGVTASVKAPRTAYPAGWDERTEGEDRSTVPAEIGTGAAAAAETTEPDTPVVVDVEPTGDGPPAT